MGSIAVRSPVVVRSPAVARTLAVDPGNTLKEREYVFNNSLLKHTAPTGYHQNVRVNFLLLLLLRWVALLSVARLLSVSWLRLTLTIRLRLSISVLWRWMLPVAGCVGRLLRGVRTVEGLSRLLVELLLLWGVADLLLCVDGLDKTTHTYARPTSKSGLTW